MAPGRIGVAYGRNGEGTGGAKGPVGRKSRRAPDEASTWGVSAPDLSRGVRRGFALNATPWKKQLEQIICSAPNSLYT
jgi:hypothetical protein